MTKGRKPFYAERMKPNGLPAELDNWYKAEAVRRGLKSGAELKRLALEEWRKQSALDEIAKIEEVIDA